MKFRRPRELSENIEDRRGAGPQRGGRGMTAAGLGGAGGLAGIIALLVAFCGGGGVANLSPGADVSLGGAADAGTTLEAPLAPEDDPLLYEAQLASVVLDNSQFFWEEVFAENGLQWRDATMVLYDSLTPTGCGQGDAGMGPFYCSLDDGIYLDLTFWGVLNQQFGADGDCAQAYVISHEVAHHVRNLLGISEEVRRLGAQNPGDRNALSVAQELQADCFAGVWAESVYTTGGTDEAADADVLIEIDSANIRDAIEAAEAVGDDTIQLRSTGTINQDTWTHGSSDQRVEWFLRGFESGDPASCDTFS